MAIRVDDGTGELIEIPGEGVMSGGNPTVPPDSALGWAHGAVFANTDGTASTDALYVNVGSKDAANFDPLVPALTAVRDFPIPVTDWRVWNALQTIVGTAGNDDLGITTGTYGTDDPVLTSGTVSGASATRYARAFCPVPNEYVAGQPITVTIPWARSDAAEVAATLDLEVFIGGNVAASDLVTTAAVNVNGAASGTATFTVTPTSVAAGQLLDMRVALALDDTGGAGSAVTISATANFTTRRLS